MIKWTSICLVIAFFVAGVYLVLGDNGLLHVYRLKKEKEELEARKVELQHQEVEYQERIERLQSDPAVIEREIRQELKFVRADEKVFVIKPTKAGGP
ncbi:MAG: septum formation initiator family protein [Candidatus Lernaella stagnicola]|nr:septum formation initiator family protein [Candidatus Lernaella stagnicola]